MAWPPPCHIGRRTYREQPPQTSQLKLVWGQHPPTHPGKWEARPAMKGQAMPSGASSHDVGGPVRAPGDPGRLLAAPVLAAAQGVCGNDTARAAEIPPPDIGWKVEQLVRDNQWRSIAARRGRTARGRGGAAGRSGGTRGRGQKTQRSTKGHSRVSQTQSVQRDITWATNITKESHLPQLHKSLIQVTTQQDQTPGFQGDITGSQVCNNDTGFNNQ